MTKIRQALISVSDKTGLVEFAQALTALGVKILSTGGTARLLEKSGIAATEVSAHTGFPKMVCNCIRPHIDIRVSQLHVAKRDGVEAPNGGPVGGNSDGNGKGKGKDKDDDDPKGGPKGGKIDRCLVGKWETVAGVGGQFQGGIGFRLTFKADGTQIADFAPDLSTASSGRINQRSSLLVSSTSAPLRLRVTQPASPRSIVSRICCVVCSCTSVRYTIVASTALPASSSTITLQRSPPTF